MKEFLYLAAVFATVLTANAQSDLEAMVNYAATTPSGGPPVFSPVISDINGPIGWTFQTKSDIDVTALSVFELFGFQVRATSKSGCGTPAAHCWLPSR